MSAPWKWVGWLFAVVLAGCLGLKNPPPSDVPSEESGPDCDGGLLFCDSGAGGCVDLTTNNANCGACGNRCPTGGVCSGGICICPVGQTACGSGASAVCSDLTSDNANCGRCRGACSAGLLCSGGVCGTVCGVGLTNCSGSCRLLTNDSSNCSSCGNRCPPSQICVDSVCRCVSGQTNCGGSCVNTATDVNHCGACGHVCSLPNAVARCSLGACAVSRCDVGFDDCDRTAANGCEANLNTNGAHCGLCGRMCDVTSSCIGGGCCSRSGCACISQFTRCGDQCVSLATNSSNCGACDAGCRVGVCCAAGRCSSRCL